MAEEHLETSAGSTLAIIGCGKMGTAIFSGLLSLPPSSSLSPPSASTPSSNPSKVQSHPFINFIACVRTSEAASRIKSTLPPQTPDSFTILQNDNPAGIASASVVILAVKPASLASLLGDHTVRASLDGKLVISILAGVSTAQIQQYFPKPQRIIIAIPNLAAAERASMTVIAQPEVGLSDPDVELVTGLFGAIGSVRFVAEDRFCAATVLSAATPAFAAYFLEALVKGGEAVGLGGEEALEMAVTAVEGMARLVIGGENVSGLRQRVATPGGITMEGLEVLEEMKVADIVSQAIKRAKENTEVVGRPGKS